MTVHDLTRLELVARARDLGGVSSWLWCCSCGTGALTLGKAAAVDAWERHRLRELAGADLQAASRGGKR